MTLATHTLAGLIIGKITGNFTAALAGSILIDLDHIISFFKHGVLFKPKKLFNLMKDEIDPWDDQRNFLHSIFGLIIISLLFLLLNFKIGLIFSIAYFIHLALDALDSANFYPFFPFFKKTTIKGFIKYWSKQEVVFDICLVLILIALFIIK